jgi:ATP-dependent DNA helicase RecG
MPEHQNIEWKESWRDEYLKWICAFANSQGGALVIGKRDDGSIKGIDNARRLLESLPNKFLQKLNLICDVNLRTEGDLEYLEIQVDPSISAVAFDGRYFKRTGSTTQLLTGQVLSDFLLKKSNRDWDAVIMESMTIDDIDSEAIEFFKKKAIEKGRIPSLTESTSTENILRNLGLMNEDDQLTRAAILLFGKKPLDVDLSAYLKIGKFGTSGADLIIHDDIESDAFRLADRALEILDAKYILSPISYKGLSRIETPEFPYEAIREILFNAIIHREYRSTPVSVRIYPDRLRIWNIGILPDGVTLEGLKEDHESRPRNRLMAKAFYMGGHIESWGRGTIKIIEECEKYGLPEPKIEETEGGVAVTLYKNKTAPEFLSTLDLNDRQLKAIEYLKEKGEMTTSFYQEKMEISYRSAIRDLKQLVDLEVLEKLGENKGAKYILK